jgi:hypothetical protein
VKPCPFVKAHKVNEALFDSTGGGLYYVECTCGAKGPYARTKTEARKKWDDRLAEEGVN